MTLSDEAIERVARAIREHHSTIVRQPSRTFGQRKTFHQGDAKAARAALEASGLVDQSERIKALEDRLATARDGLIDVAASLAAALSLLERGGKAAKKAAPSDKMFDQMLKDYRASLARVRTDLVVLDVIKEKNGE